MTRAYEVTALDLGINNRVKIVLDAMIQNDCSEDEMVFVMYQSNPAWDYSCDKPSRDPAEVYETYMKYRRAVQEYLKIA